METNKTHILRMRGKNEMPQTQSKKSFIGVETHFNMVILTKNERIDNRNLRKGDLLEMYEEMSQSIGCVRQY